SVFPRPLASGSGLAAAAAAGLGGACGRSAVSGQVHGREGRARAGWSAGEARQRARVVSAAWPAGVQGDHAGWPEVLR
ncbi:unnamed protein product, partial [Urochloa humidicola]